MKNLINYLNALWSRVADSQSSDVRHDCRRSDLRRSPSGLDAKWKQNPFMRFAVVLTLIFTIGSGNVWGATETITMSEMGWDNASTQSSIPASSATIALAKNSGSTAPTYYTSDGLRIYGVKSATTGGTIAFTAVDEITQIQFTHTAQNSGVLSIKSGGGSYSSKKWTGTLTAGNTLTLVATNSGTKAPQVRITVIAITYKAKVTFNANGGSCATSSLTQSTPTSTITLPTPTRAGYTCTGWYTASSGGTKRGNAGATYTPSASETLYAQWASAGTSVSLSKAATTNGSFTLSPASSVTTTGAAGVVTVTATPDAGYYLSNLTATNPTTGTATVTGSGNTRTVTYSSGANGPSTITATFSAISRTISYSGDTHISSYTTKPTSATIEDDEVLVEYTVASGYVITAISATMGGAAIAAGDMDWNQTQLEIMPTGGITGNIAITFTIAETGGYCISAFNSSNNGITSGFSNGGSGNEYTLSYTIPGKDGSSNWPQYWIGENNAFQSSYSVTANFADMPLTSNNSATLGLAQGATGTLHIWNNNIQANTNLYVKFEPSGYGLRWGGAGEWDQAANTKAFTVDPGDANVYWTDIVTLDGTNNTTWNYYVGLQTASGYVYSGVDNEASDSRGISRTRSVTAMKVSNGTSGSWKATYLDSEPTNSRGKFRIWNNNITDYNFVCHWVPFYRVTYNGSGASGSTSPSADVCCEGNAAARTVKAAANGFTVPTGKSFGGWASSPENAAAKIVAYAANADVTLTGSITLYAIWNDIDYTVTVNQSPSVGATTTGQTTTAHYNGTINLTTTVPSGYRFVNWTTSDGFSITNSTSATTASFTMPNKSVTVTANFQQTHTVDWYVGGSAPANKIGADGQTTVVDHGGKISDFPAHDPDGSACDKEFVGWTNTTSYVHGTSLLFTDVAGSPQINADAQFYAVFAEVTGGTDYEQVTSLDDIHDGPAYFAYYGSYSGSRWYGVNSVSTITAPVTVSEGVLTTSTGDYTLTEFTIVTVDAANHIYYIKIGDDYVIGSSSGSNTDLSLDDDPYAWTFESINSTTYNMQISHTYTTPSTTCYMKAGVGTATGGKFRSYSTSGQQISLFQTTESVTGHTINCADCGSSVTPTYTAAPTGGTVSVTKSAAAVASGSTVKTCTSVDLTVTINPAPHYTLTGFTATGLSTGTATISPAVNTVVPTTSAQTFTVTVSAGATGTLNLTPTFTPETPLTITLDTHSKGTFTPIGTIYSGDSFTFPEVTPNDAECADFVGWVEGTSIAEEGTSTEPTTIAAGSSSGTLTTNKTYTAVYAEKDKTESDAYVKVTSSLSNWSGTYLIVHDGSSRALDGSLTTTLGSTGDYFSVSITDGAIAATSTLATKNWTIAKIGETSTYTIKSASGYYIGRATASNGLDYTTAAGDADANSITYSSGVSIAGSASTAKLQYWVSGANACFKYYTSSQNAVSLYKLGTAEIVTYTYTVNPACTAKYRVTVNSATGGSPTADPKYLPEGETVTLTANPAAGYTFTSWTITKTTGGDNVTSTLLTGDKPTTANTSFAMPAYDVTVTAAYAKIYVTSVVAKDGETTLNTSDHKLNINTGANKTVTVVVTPADAFDHSWSAEVTSGGTYASISNVADGSFRVNGLAQGDATIVVTAPNDDGTDKTATFTVHVTDVLPEEIILKRDGSVAEIETLTMYYDAANSRGQYVKVNVSYSPTPTNKNFTFTSAATGKVGSHSHSNVNLYEVLVANGVTSSPVNCTFTSEADGSVTKVLAVTVLPLLTDRFVDYIQGNATQTVSARLSADRYDIITDINTPSISDASDANPTSEDCKTAHYHMIGWLPQATAEALWAAGTAITEDTEGLVSAGATVEATGQTWYAIWAKEE